MQSRTPNFIFNPNFNFATQSLFSSFDTVPADIIPPLAVCYILSETGDYLLSEDNNNLILEVCILPQIYYVLTETGYNVLTEGADLVLVE